MERIRNFVPSSLQLQLQEHYTSEAKIQPKKYMGLENGSKNKQTLILGWKIDAGDWFLD